MEFKLIFIVLEELERKKKEILLKNLLGKS
jgi:hypothetical protein